jgi:hypothetical protein
MTQVLVGEKTTTMGEIPQSCVEKHTKNLHMYQICRTISRFQYPCGWQSFLWAGHCCQALATYPEVERSGPLLLPYLVLLHVGFTLPERIAPSAVRSYRTFSPLPPCGGGTFSVALSVKPALSRPPRPLAGTPPFGDRTFLARAGPKPGPRATAHPADPLPLSPFSAGLAPGAARALSSSFPRVCSIFGVLRTPRVILAGAARRIGYGSKG